MTLTLAQKLQALKDSRKDSNLGSNSEALKGGDCAQPVSKSLEKENEKEKEKLETLEPKLNPNLEPKKVAPKPKPINPAILKLRAAQAKRAELAEKAKLDSPEKNQKDSALPSKVAKGIDFTKLPMANEVKAEEVIEEKVTVTLEVTPKQITTLESNLLTVTPEKVKQLNKDEVTFNNLNSKQREAVELGIKLKSFCLIGSAGSGKTTTQRVLLMELLNSGLLQQLNEKTKFLYHKAPSVLITSFTKVATRNIKEAAPNAFKPNCINIHKALEYEPTKKTMNEGTKEEKEVMVFEPQRTKENPLPNITHCIIEESGSVDVELFRQLRAALPSDCIFIFLGDLNQLPPVYGAAILGFALQKLPIIELTEVYRQDVGPIKELAYLVLEGKPLKYPVVEKLQELNSTTSKLNLVPMSKKHEGIKLNKMIGDYMVKEVENGNFIEGDSVILCPFRKDSTNFLNITELNRHIAQAFTKSRGVPTFEVITKGGIGKKNYFAVGDLVFYEREYYKITDIVPNKKYLKTFGKDYADESLTLNRWGFDPMGGHLVSSELDSMFDSINATVEELMDQDSDELTKSTTAPSHIITMEAFDQDPDEITRRLTIASSGEINNITLGYAQTVHSAQGSEWQNVYCAFPTNCSFKLNREMLYTALTRARTNLTMFCEDGLKPYNYGKGTFQSGIKRQAIVGDTLETKKAYFAKLVDNPAYSDILGLLS